jgi:hypothetical protein
MQLLDNSTVYCSIGENCLSQDIIDRRKMNTMISPFSRVRSNIDYALALLKEDFVDFLNPEYLQYRERYDKKIVTNSKYKCAPGVFDSSVANEFEFTHHDVIASDEALKSFERKTERFRALIKSESPITFLYHHRSRPGKQMPHVLAQLNEFARHVEGMRNAPVSVICFAQTIFKDISERRIEITQHERTMLAVLHTKQAWLGTDADVFWGRVDDDLFDQMLEASKQARVAIA